MRWIHSSEPCWLAVRTKRCWNMNPSIAASARRKLSSFVGKYSSTMEPMCRWLGRCYVKRLGDGGEPTNITRDRPPAPKRKNGNGMCWPWKATRSPFSHLVFPWFSVDAYWLVVWNVFCFPYIGNVIIPIDNWRTHIFQRGGSTTNQLYIPINHLVISH